MLYPLTRLVLACAFACVAAPAAAQTARPPQSVPSATLLRIIEAEDQRRWDAATLGALLRDPQAAVRQRAALAAGRIGDAAAVAPLSTRLASDQSMDVRAIAAFALGEIEAEAGAATLLEALRSASPAVRARAIEALGKIGAAAVTSASMKARAGEAIVAALAEERRRTAPNRDVVLLGLTATFRSRVAASPATAALFLDSPDARVRADALNALARMRANESLPQVRMLFAGDPDPLVRANAARVIGAATDAASSAQLLRATAADQDVRVRVSAVRALALLNDRTFSEPLIVRGEALLAALRMAIGAGTPRPAEANELLEIATALGRLQTTTDNARAIGFLRQLRMSVPSAPEVDIALARIGPAAYVNPLLLRGALGASWQQVSAVAQALGEIGGLMNLAPMVRSAAEMRVRALLGAGNTPSMAVPDLLRALQAYGPGDLAAVTRSYLQASDVTIRATAAEILGGLPADAANAQALVSSLTQSRAAGMNDAVLATLDALAGQSGDEVDTAIRDALSSANYLVRRRASDAIRQRNPAANAPSPGLAESGDRRASYERAIARIGRRVQAIVNTEKGAVTIDLLPEDAPLTVDNFVALALLNHFEGLTFHRVVSNFVVQGGDPRGDGSGGPGYEIRCEVNLVPHSTGVLAMALSGKDTGGSQVYITHSPQPHLDGGYTVFGRVTMGQEVVDRVVRGDRILSVTIVETPARP